jgi:hypothetical protein
MTRNSPGIVGPAMTRSTRVTPRCGLCRLCRRRRETMPIPHASGGKRFNRPSSGHDCRSGQGAFGRREFAFPRRARLK